MRSIGCAGGYMCIPAQTAGKWPADAEQIVKPEVFVPARSTLVILFEMASARLMACSHDGGVLTDARLILVTEELNAISDDIRAATNRPASADAAASGSIKDPAR